MPFIDLIQPLVNRTFGTGSGNWTGDLVWHPEEFKGQQGFIAASLGPQPDEKTISLAYPYMKTNPGFLNPISYLNAYDIGVYRPYNTTINITDGVYSIDIGPFLCGYWPDWLTINSQFDCPADWVLEGTLYKIKIESANDQTIDVYFDNFTNQAEVEEKTDHLAIMGVH